jgi:hypothetical protein
LRWHQDRIIAPLANAVEAAMTRKSAPSHFGELHAGNLLLGSNNELVAIGRLDKRFLPRAGRYKFESQEFRTRPIPSDTTKGPIQLSNA